MAAVNNQFVRGARVSRTLEIAKAISQPQELTIGNVIYVLLDINDKYHKLSADELKELVGKAFDAYAAAKKVFP